MLCATRLLAAAALAGWMFTSSVSAEVKLPGVISDHMVLQHDAPLPIWGTAKPGEKITVKFRDQEKTTEAGKDGNWMVTLDKERVGGGKQMIIKGENTITIDDILIGDVWVGSGQSNMQIGVNGFVERDPVLKKYAEGSYPGIRLITPHGKWMLAKPENIKGFSALLFSFGVPLQHDLDIPVGLMVGAVGGTPSGAWLTQEHFDADPACKAAVENATAKLNPAQDKADFEKAMADYEKSLAAYKDAVAKDPAAAKPAAPGQRAKLSAPRKPAMPGKPGEMPNGVKPGYLYDANIKPYIPFAIKGVLWDQGESGTQLRDIDQYTTMGALIRGWRKTWGQGDFPFLYVQKPSGGGIALNPNDPITNAASKFGALPPAPSGNASSREVHIKIREYPSTFMVTASDLGGGTHPINKSGYGARAARVALGAVYGKPIEFYGPVYDSLTVDGSKMRLKFTHVGQGLVAAQSEKLQGFAVAGEDKKFYWADATIEGDSVVLHCDKVAKPVAARYAWDGSHAWANLFNKDGLPTQSFRTDSW